MEIETRGPNFYSSIFALGEETAVKYTDIEFPLSTGVYLPRTILGDRVRCHSMVQRKPATSRGQGRQGGGSSFCPQKRMKTCWVVEHQRCIFCRDSVSLFCRFNKGATSTSAAPSLYW